MNEYSLANVQSLIYFNSIFYRFDAAKVGFITVFAKYLG